MSYRRDASHKPRLLVDASFLLLALGIDVEEKVYDAIAKFRE